MRKFLIALALVAVAIVAVLGYSTVQRQLNLNNPDVLTQGVSNTTGPDLSNLNLTPTAKQNPQQQADAVTADFKEDILQIFRSWKARDINEFRLSLALAYSGTLLDTKVQQAQQFIQTHEGADINTINFQTVKINSIDGTKATLDSELNYSGHAYNAGDSTLGSPFGPISLKGQYTLELKEGHWFITGENMSVSKAQS